MAGRDVWGVSVTEAVSYVLIFGGYVAMRLRAPWYVAIGLPMIGAAGIIVGMELRRRRRD